MVTKVLKAVVPVAEILGVVATAAFVVLLLAKPTAGASTVTPAGAVAAVDGAAIYRANCAACHGADGGGRLGPQLADRVASRYPDPAAEIVVVTGGRGGMPSFSARLTPEQIAAVVDYTRNGLG
jgi:mono/diheme cytochrome c family protein